MSSEITGDMDKGPEKWQMTAAMIMCVKSQLELTWKPEIILQHKAAPNDIHWLFIQIVLRNNFPLSSHDSENF